MGPNDIASQRPVSSIETCLLLNKSAHIHINMNIQSAKKVKTSLDRPHVSKDEAKISQDS